MIELVHPSAHSSPQPKWQMDLFSCFCPGYGRKCLYFTTGAPIQQNCPFPRAIWTSHVTHDAFGPCESKNQMAPRSVQPSLHRWPRSVSILYNGLPVPPQNYPFPCWHLDSIRGSLGPPESGTQMATWSFQPFFAWLTDWQSDRKTDRPRYSVRCGVIMCNYVGYGKVAIV